MPRVFYAFARAASFCHAVESWHRFPARLSAGFHSFTTSLEQRWKVSRAVEDSEDFNLLRQLSVKKQVIGVSLAREEADAHKTRRTETRTNPQVWLMTKALSSIQNVVAHSLGGHGMCLADVAHDLLQVIQRDGIEYDRLHAVCLRSWARGMR